MNNVFLQYLCLSISTCFDRLCAHHQEKQLCLCDTCYLLFCLDNCLVVLFEEVLLRFNEQRNILHEIRKRKANWIGHILRRNCLLKQVIEGKIKGEMEVTRRQGRRHRKLLDDLKDRRGYSHLKDKALDRTMWRNHFRGGFGPVVRQNTECMNES